MRAQRAKLSRGNDVAKAMDYMSSAGARSPASRRRPHLPVEQRGGAWRARHRFGAQVVVVLRLDRGGERAAVMYSLIVTAKMNDVDPQAWLADVLARIAEHPVQQLDELLPWNWRAGNRQVDQAA